MLFETRLTPSLHEFLGNCEDVPTQDSSNPAPAAALATPLTSSHASKARMLAEQAMENSRRRE